jgi:hypothetical protein
MHTSITQITNNRVRKGIEKQRNKKRQAYQRCINSHHLRVENQQKIIKSVVFDTKCHGAKAIGQLG